MSDTYGQYRFIERIAEGGMGEVFKAKLVRGAGFEKLVAVKRMLPQISSKKGFAEMFKAEARLAARFNHNNVVQVYDFGQQAGSLFLAMEYVEGVDLGGLIAMLKSSDATIPQALLLRIAIEACRGLDYVHRLKDEHGQELGLVHRDISPSNILVSFEGQVKVTDFGIARPRQSGNDEWLAGKLSYLSPEQVCGEPLDRRSDIYSLGVVLYELLYLKKAFPANGVDTEEILCAVREGHMKWQSNNSIAPGLTEILKKSTACQKAERYSTARQMQRELESCLDKIDSEDAELGRWLAVLFPERSESSVVMPERTILSTQPISPVKTPPKNIIDNAKPKKALKRTLLLALPLLLLAALAYWYFFVPSSVLLKLQSTPSGALIQLDGRTLGITPMDKARLPLDSQPHKLRLTLADFAPYEESLLAKGRKAIERKIVFERLQRAVNVKSDPEGASVWLNGKKLDGATPLELGVLDVGVRHSLRLEKDGQVPIEREFIITEAIDEPLAQSYKFRSLYARLKVECTPADCDLYMEGKRQKGKSPYTIEGVMRRRKVTLTASRKGYISREVPITPGQEETTELKIALEPFSAEAVVDCAQAAKLTLDGKPASSPLKIEKLHQSARMLKISDKAGNNFVMRAKAQQIKNGHGRFLTQLECNINASPWAKVFIDNREALATPASKIKLPAGKHRLRVKFKDKEPPLTMHINVR